MNRVYPLREGSGECYALICFDARGCLEFRLREKNTVSDHEFGRGVVACTPQVDVTQSRLRMTASKKTLAPLVFGILKFSHASRPPMLPICAGVPCSSPRLRKFPAIPRAGRPRRPASFDAQEARGGFSVSFA